MQLEQLAAGAPSTAPAPPDGSRRCAGMVVVAVELALIVVIVYLFEIERRRHFLAVMCLAAAGFPIHSALPSRWRAWFFPALSLGSILFILGWPGGAWVIGLGSGLILIASLPLALWLRGTLLAVAGLGLAVMRLGSIESFWPVLGSMFMFRAVIYLHDTRHPPRPSLPTTFAYFLPLPNVCFPFFPVLDFKTWRDRWQQDNDVETYQTGARWIVRGITHLLGYRFVKLYLLPAPSELQDVPHLLLFLATNYALYLHVSGHFHIVAGILHLFGFRLPPTHDHYFLASSCTDIWRRINIYWKDFMTKMFFMPAFFRLRRLGTRPALALATLWVFLATWLLHSYQIFWLLGRLPLSLREGWLWLGVGVVVALNLQRDLSRAALPPQQRARMSAPGAARHALKVLGMFMLVSLFWAVWTWPGFLARLPALSGDGTGIVSGLGWLATAAALALATGVAAHRFRQPWSAGLSRMQRAAPAVTLILLLLATLLPLPDSCAALLTALRRESYTPAEMAWRTQGYYEEVTAARASAGSFLLTLEGDRPPDPGANYMVMSRPTDDVLERELIPNWTGEVVHRRLTINRLGLRDRPDLQLARDPATYRIAVLGSSIVMGYGVSDDETFPRLLEDRLNAQWRPDQPRYELVNFGVGMNAATHRRALLERKVFDFKPDMLFYVAHPDEFQSAPRHLATMIVRGTTLPYPSFRSAKDRARLAPGMPAAEIEARLRAVAGELIRDIYREIGDACREREVVPVLVYLPLLGVEDAAARSGIRRLAEEAGFRFVDLTGWSDGQAPQSVLITTQDHHPNALGQRLIAELLASRLQGQGIVPAAVR